MSKRSRQQEPEGHNPSKESKVETVSVCDLPTDLTFQSFFNQHNQEFMEGDRITIRYKGKESALFCLIDSEILFQVNNFPVLEKFCYDTYCQTSTIFNKCHHNIFITGLVRSGKTTIASLVFPYIYTRITKYEQYRIFTYDFASLTEETTVEDILMNFLGKPSTIIACQNIDNNPIIDFLNTHPRVMHYLIFDEIQVACPKKLAVLKKIFKLPVLSGKNILSIWTGSTQSVLYKKLKQIPTNGFSFQDNCYSFLIPQQSSVENLKELAVFRNCVNQELVLTREKLQIVKNGLGFLNCSYIDQILNDVRRGNSWKKSISIFVSKLFEIYDRDFANSDLVAKMDVTVALKIFKLTVFSEENVNRTLSSLSIYDVSEFFDESNENKFTLRDSLLDIYINTRVLEKTSLPLEYEYLEVFPFVVLGESLVHNNIDLKLLGIEDLKQTTRFSQYLNRSFLTDHKPISWTGEWIHTNELQSTLRQILIAIRNILSHKHDNCSLIREALKKYWCGDNEEQFMKLKNTVRIFPNNTNQ